MGGNRSWVYVVDKAGIVVVGIVCKVVDKVGMVGIEANAQRQVLQVTRWSRVA